MHLRILPDHQKLFFKKDIFYRLEWLKTCFDAFAHTSRPPETFYQKRYFWKSGVVKKCLDAFANTSRPPETFFQKRYLWQSEMVKNVFWCIFVYFQTTRIMSFKKIFFNVRRGLKRILMHLRILPDHQKLFSKEMFFFVWSG